MRKGTLIRGLGLTAGLLLGLAGSAQAGTHGDVLTFKQPYPLSDSTRLEVQGRQVGAGAASVTRGQCRLPRATLSLAPHERAVELRQVALNRRTCRAVFERGVPPKSSRAQAAGAQESAGSRRAGGSGAQALATSPTWGGWSSAWYRDRRRGRIVSRVQSGADWTAKGGCIDASNTWFRNQADKSSGWNEVSHRWSKINDRCEFVVSSTNAHFRDQRFRGCGGSSTIRVVDSFYNRVRFVGYPDGRIRGSKSSWNEPSCKDVLIAYYALYRR
jgi:hypothetical protein